MATAVYFAEEGEPDSKFDSIPAAIWWSFITISTIGYGDVVPSSNWGKVVGSLASIAGIICLSLPLPAIVQNFHKVHALEGRRKFSEKVFTQLKINRAVKEKLFMEIEKKELAKTVDTSLQVYGESYPYPQKLLKHIQANYSTPGREMARETTIYHSC